MKLPYVFASALQIMLARQMMFDAMITTLLPYMELTGTLETVSITEQWYRDRFELVYQNRLLNPRTRIHTPVNCTTSASE